MPPEVLHRSRQGAVVFGVCSGLGQYLSVDPVLVRAVFVLLALLSGVGVVAYLVLALLMPAEETVGEPLATVVQFNARELGELAGAVGRELAQAARWRSRPDHRRKAVGRLLVAVGLLALAVKLGLAAWLQWRLWWPLVLVAVGLALMRGRG